MFWWFWLIVGIFIFIFISICCCFCSYRKKKKRRDFDTEFGDISLLENISTGNKSVGIELGQPDINITKPYAVRGKLYNQDYKEITDKVFLTGILFKDEKVYIICLLAHSLFNLILVPTGQILHQLYWEAEG